MSNRLGLKLRGLLFCECMSICPSEGLVRIDLNDFVSKVLAYITMYKSFSPEEYCEDAFAVFCEVEDRRFSRSRIPQELLT